MKLKIFQMIQLNNTIEDFMDEVCKQAKFLFEHHYIKNCQAPYLEHCKSTLPEDNALILLDFAENYSFIIQYTIQSYHWSKSQATLHPCVIYKRNHESLTHKSVCVISDHMKHDSNASNILKIYILKRYYMCWESLQKCVYFPVQELQSIS